MLTHQQSAGTVSVYARAPGQAAHVSRPASVPIWSEREAISLVCRRLALRQSANRIPVTIQVRAHPP